MALSRSRSLQLGRLVAVGRIGLGVVAVTAPRLPLRPWVGDRRDDPAMRLLARALGGRDLALGLGVVLALRADGPARGWVEAGGLADAGDAVFTLLSFRHLPRGGRWLVLAAAAGGAVAARLVSVGIDPPLPPPA